MAEQTGLAANYHTKLGYLIIGGFDGNLTGFNMWDEHIDNVSRLKTQACSYVTGNVVAWPEVQLWRIGNITKQNTSLCKYSGKVPISLGKWTKIVVPHPSCHKSVPNCFVHGARMKCGKEK